MNPIKKHLKQKAHHLNPVVRTGDKGLTDAVHKEIDLALNSHELIKIKLVAADKTARKAMIDTICEKHEAELIQSIGHVIAIYRKSPPAEANATA
jgi:RNA-binding protein